MKKRVLSVLVLAVLILSACSSTKLPAEKIDSFMFRIGGFGRMNYYTVSKEDLTLTLDLQEKDPPVKSTSAWDQTMWDAFIKDILACGVSDWKSEYINPNIMDGTQWGLEITGEFETISIMGSNKYPKEWKEFLNVLSIHFGIEVH